jgi:hypothetical protein
MEEQEVKKMLDWIDKKEEEAAQEKRIGYDTGYCDGKLNAYQEVKQYLQFINEIEE